MSEINSQGPAQRRLRWLIADLKLEVALLRLARKYRPDQARDDRGRWVDEGGGRESGSGDADDTLEVSAARKVPPIVKRFGQWTARQYVSKHCEAAINRKLPGEFEDMTITDIWNIARGGDARARTCLKLLNRNEYRK